MFKMFRMPRSLDVVTLFHKASSPASVRVHTLLKQASANAAEYATEDQASNHSGQTNPKRAEFQLDVTEEPPTSDQLRTILEYMGGGKAAGLLVKGAVSENDALKKLKENTDNFQRPLTVDWNNGKAIPGADESQILKMLSQLPQAS